MVMVNRGRGSYNLGTGNIIAHFQNALREHGFKIAMGSNASIQLCHMQEIFQQAQIAVPAKAESQECKKQSSTDAHQLVKTAQGTNRKLSQT